MKLSKILFVGLIVVFIFSLSACLYVPASYVCDTNTVDSVQIVRIGQLNEETREFEYAVIVDIVDCSTFVGRLNNLEDNDFFFLLGDPDVFFDGDVAIRVNYHNGDYDLLKCKVQKFYRSGVSASGRVSFKQDQFNALINDYLPKTDMGYKTGDG